MKTSHKQYSFFVISIFILFTMGISCEKDHETDNPKSPRCPNAESTIATGREYLKR